MMKIEKYIFDDEKYLKKNGNSIFAKERKNSFGDEKNF